MNRRLGLAGSVPAVRIGGGVGRPDRRNLPGRWSGRLGGRVVPRHPPHHPLYFSPTFRNCWRCTQKAACGHRRSHVI